MKMVKKLTLGLVAAMALAGSTAPAASAIGGKSGQWPPDFTSKSIVELFAQAR